MQNQFYFIIFQFLFIAPSSISTTLKKEISLKKNSLSSINKIQKKRKINPNLPMNTPIDSNIINGRRLPKINRHRSLSEPSTGVKKNPTSGDSAHTNVMC